MNPNQLFLIVLPELWTRLISISRFFGQAIVVVFFWFSVFSLSHLIAVALELSSPFIDIYNIADSLYDEKVAWASTSIVLATSVAFGHMKNLKINEEKYFNEMMDKHTAQRNTKATDTPEQTRKLNEQLRS